MEFKLSTTTREYLHDPFNKKSIYFTILFISKEFSLDLKIEGETIDTELLENLLNDIKNNKSSKFFTSNLLNINYNSEIDYLFISNENISFKIKNCYDIINILNQIYSYMKKFI
jgi:hypothetical protein